jgi:hypothetical protein
MLGSTVGNGVLLGGKVGAPVGGKLGVKDAVGGKPVSLAVGVGGTWVGVFDGSGVLVGFAVSDGIGVRVLVGVGVSVGISNIVGGVGVTSLNCAGGKIVFDKNKPTQTQTNTVRPKNRSVMVL